jgi:uncharacterized OsmC-like protein
VPKSAETIEHIPPSGSPPSSFRSAIGPLYQGSFDPVGPTRIAPRWAYGVQQATGEPIGHRGVHVTSTSPVEAPTSYRVHGVGHPGGHSRIRCNSTDLKADTGSVSDGFRPGPAELLCASLAACLLKNIERFSEMLPFQYETAAVDVEAFRHDAPPKMTRMRYRIEVVTDEPEHRVDLLHRNIRKHGTITNTLDVACELTGEMVARRSNEGDRTSLSATR